MKEAKNVILLSVRARSILPEQESRFHRILKQAATITSHFPHCVPFCDINQDSELQKTSPSCFLSIQGNFLVLI